MRVLTLLIIVAAAQMGCSRPVQQKDFASAEDLLDRVYELLCEESNYLRADLRESTSGRGRQPEASDEGAAGGLPPAATAR